MADELTCILITPCSPRKSRTGGIISLKTFGRTIMINASHAPGSPENVRREMPVIRAAENNLKPLLEACGLSV
ncbi:MAG: hypothetical protein D4R65_15750 [Verrucomicrobiaceae bacterium]|nr:MAG: hypothetical protein D4R65_15750 [Verrucomicrobiaceae bacterium]